MLNVLTGIEVLKKLLKLLSEVEKMRITKNNIKDIITTTLLVLWCGLVIGAGIAVGFIAVGSLWLRMG